MNLNFQYNAVDVYAGKSINEVGNVRRGELSFE